MDLVSEINVYIIIIIMLGVNMGVLWLFKRSGNDKNIIVLNTIIL